MATTFPVEQTPPTAFKLQHSSPLDTLVRRTSAKRARAVVQSTASQQYPASVIDAYTASSPPPSQDELYPDTDPSFVYQQQQQPPSSPLLHSHFARNSTATASMTGSYSDLRSSMDSRNAYQELEYRYRGDEESVYSQVDSLSPALRDSWRSGVSTRTVRPDEPAVPHGASTKSARAPAVSPEAGSGWTTTAVPTVVVSSPDADNSSHASQAQAGRMPVVRPITSNFSRPVRPSQQQFNIPQQQAVTVPPPLPQDASDQKRRVLERNANRAASNSPSPQQPQQSHSQEQMRFFRRSKSPTPSPVPSAPNPYLSSPATRVQQRPQHTSPISSEDSNPLPNPYSDQPATKPIPPNRSNQYRDPSPIASGRQRTPSPQPLPLDQQVLAGRRSPQPPFTLASPPNSGNSADGLTPVALPRQPPARSNSPASLYSSYSYYNYESAVPSPTSSGPPSRASPAPQQHLQQSHGGSQRLQPDSSKPQQRSRSPNNNNHNNPRTSSPLVTSPVDEKFQTPQDFLQLGIQNHEANRLKESAMYFEKSAKENGGCGVGMLMWGLTLRHGWGCEKNEKVGFKWLRKAAESAVVDLESARGGKSVDTTPVQDELVLAIYEVGQCFFHGWGVNKDQKMAVSYYTVAARLGDSDAQNDLAFCLANGKGCKKDRKEAAKWYRAAVAQGVSDVGLAWIYKEKFM
ncbi:hypothetical protein D9756_004309 [Leucocoprinus leucothites]|uniref:HCP-like protein n=1 Tax=Leucocoprinus leucothites TaxID=201217 RepID=A0A8H5D9Q7_9AGAR|nr:hypothetical protein D9756_004309 [Leucoagaricus leucothites]